MSTAKIETATARLKLEAAKKPYFRQIAPGLSLGYRRTMTGAGRWVVRRADGKGGNTVLNLMTTAAPLRPVVADDFDPANGCDVMTFAQAQAAAGGPSRSGGSFTVADAVAHYVKIWKSQGRDTRSSESKANAWINEASIGATEIADLTREQMRDWLMGIASKPLKGSQETDPAKRASRRRSTANRVLGLLKAALNLCYLELVDGRKVVDSDFAWKRLSPLEDATNVRDRWLDLFEAQRFERGCSGDFRELVKGALLTGARYGQLISAKVTQFEPATRTLRLETRKGRSGAVHKYRVYLHAEAVAFFAARCAGRRGDELIFTNDGQPWDEGEQIRLTNAASDAAGIVPRVTFHGLRHTYASLSLQSDPPMTLLILSRNLGHKNTKRVEETYGHLAAAHITAAVNASAPSFGFTAATNVRALR